MTDEARLAMREYVNEHMGKRVYRIIAPHPWIPPRTVVGRVVGYVIPEDQHDNRIILIHLDIEVGVALNDLLVGTVASFINKLEPDMRDSYLRWDPDTIRFLVEKKVDMSLYPHVCPCGAPAYLGFKKIDCTASACRYWSGCC